MADLPNELDTSREEVSHLVERLSLAKEEQQESLFEQAIEQVEPGEIALLLESLPIGDRLERWQQVAQDEQLDVLVAMRAEARGAILRTLPEPTLAALLDRVDAESLIELADDLPVAIVDDAVTRMTARQRNWFEQASQYGDDEVGRYLNHEMVLVPANARAGDALRVLLRSHYPFSDQAYLVDALGLYRGAISLKQLASLPDTQRLKEVPLLDLVPLQATTSVVDATEAVEHSGLAALPVVDTEGRLQGRISLQLALELTREEYESRLMATVGLDEETDLFSPVLQSSKRRALWLGINLLTALLASWVIGRFEATLVQVVSLAVLMPIVASMGGIAGSQTLTLVVRGLAMGQLAQGNLRALLSKEIGVGVLNGIAWSVIIGAVAGLWFGDLATGLVMAAAIIINITVAALAGVLVPVVLDRRGIDPALSGSVVLTTVTDVVGFLTFLGLGSLVLVP
ncbi:magnesium transporter [Ferrimonas sediminicola]|uniref:Magnesium transporter n=1 Tax=Ferrimonas sediminicola TaxID=2569538 RepID=A0A4U1BK95_9GAMM|nr:magnesium transporter [Ferrimonas sediminicola]TKB50520.1 magnesium transporter [Ferrimonas sediminicola]